MKLKTLTAVAFAIVAGTVIAQNMQMNNDPMVGGSPMMKSMNIVENAMNSKEHMTLVSAVKAAGLVDTLKGSGPFTVFAPTDDAFKKIPTSTLEMWMEPENKEALKKLLTYHVLAGRVDSKELRSWIMKGNGTAELKTVSGGKLWAMMNGPSNIVIKDEKGMIARIPTYDVYQSNGVIHVIDAVLMPK